MSNLFIGHFQRIVFNANGDTMTKNYHDKATEYSNSINSMSFESRLGNFELVIGTYEEVQSTIAKQISHYLTCAHLKPQDFSFVFSFEEIKAGVAFFPKRNSGSILLQ